MSLYWRSADITDPALRARTDELQNGTAELRLAACEALLDSGDPVAAGIAADSYFAACADERWASRTRSTTRPSCSGRGRWPPSRSRR
jgi:hypothetical protein